MNIQNEANEEYRVYIRNDEECKVKIGYAKFSDLHQQICYNQGYTENDVKGLWKFENEEDAQRVKQSIKRHIVRKMSRLRNFDGYHIYREYGVPKSDILYCKPNILNFVCMRKYRRSVKIENIPNDIWKSKILKKEKGS